MANKARIRLQNSTLFTYNKARMTNRIYLQMQLQKAVRKYGENSPVTLAIKRQIQEVLSSEGRAKLQHFRRISEARKQVN